MRFFLHADHGHLIKGWVVPDNPVAISRVYVSVEGRRVAEVPATLTDPVLQRRGWHATGQCHFEVTEESVPGLAGIEQLEIHDVDTNILVYRRTPDHGLSKDKILLINTGIHPEAAIQATLYPHFRQSYFGIGKFPEEVMTILFDTTTLTSCFLSGAVSVPRYEHHFVQAETLTMLLVHDPFVEMATRMTWLRERVKLAEDPAQNWRLGPLAESAAFTKDYDYADPKSLKRFFRMLPEPAYHLLYNPMTRLLGTKLPDERVNPLNSIVAVEVLSRIGIVGHRDHFEAFLTTVFDRLGISAPIPAPPAVPQETLALADRLRSLKVAQDFLSFDTVISDGVRRSVAKSWLD